MSYNLPRMGEKRPSWQNITVSLIVNSGIFKKLFNNIYLLEEDLREPYNSHVFLSFMFLKKLKRMDYFG